MPTPWRQRPLQRVSVNEPHVCSSLLRNHRNGPEALKGGALEARPLLLNWGLTRWHPRARFWLSHVLVDLTVQTSQLLGRVGWNTTVIGFASSLFLIELEKHFTPDISYMKVSRKSRLARPTADLEPLLRPTTAPMKLRAVGSINEDVPAYKVSRAIGNMPNIIRVDARVGLIARGNCFGSGAFRRTLTCPWRTRPSIRFSNDPRHRGRVL